uniref:Uncharacterized protein n=1 Tax=Avena sativa TaxID=4498 RepID=A0ACD5U3L0_AVESA
MAGIVGSAVASEAVRRLSLLLSGEEDRDRETTEIKVERVEMAVLKIETVVAMSGDWQIVHAPLLRWRAKLKRVLKEGKGIVRAHRRNTAATSLERRLDRSNSLPWRMAQVARRFMPFSRGNDHPGDDDDLTDATVRRFQRIAEGADDFLKFVRCGGGRPRILMFLPSFARSLAAGETIELSLRMEGGTAVMLLQPWWLELAGGDDGTKAAACLWLLYEHDVEWERNISMMAAFRTSEALDVTRVAANCVDLLPPQFGAARATMKELVAEMAFHGRSSSANMAVVYVSLIRVVQASLEYGFEPATTRRRAEFTGGGPRLPEEILMVSTHSYVRNSSSEHGSLPMKMVWHRSPLYLPKMLSEQHEHVELLPGMADGFEAAGAVDHGRQWWCPSSSTRLSIVPVSSPPKSVLQWCKDRVLTSRISTTDCPEMWFGGRERSLSSWHQRGDICECRRSFLKGAGCTSSPLPVAYRWKS